MFFLVKHTMLSITDKLICGWDFTKKKFPDIQEGDIIELQKNKIRVNTTKVAKYISKNCFIEARQLILSKEQFLTGHKAIIHFFNKKPGIGQIYRGIIGEYLGCPVDINKEITGSGGNTCSLLWRAAQAGAYECSNLLIKAGANLDSEHSSAYKTPLIIAAENGHKNICKLLIKSGHADPNNAKTKPATMPARNTKHPIFHWMIGHLGEPSHFLLCSYGGINRVGP